MRHALSDRFFLACMLLFTAGALAFGLLLPIHEGPDEQNHYRYIVFLKDQGRLPRQLPLPPEVAGEGHQPPLYYALAAGLLKLALPSAAWTELPNSPRIAFNHEVVYFQHYREEGFLRFSGYALGPHLLRLLLLPVGVCILALLWLYLARLAPASPAGRAAFALLALNPAWVALSGCLNNDHAVTLFFSACVLFISARMKPAWGPGAAAGLGLLLGLGALSKISMLGLLPVALFAVWRLAAPGKRSAGLAALLASFAALCGWFFIRNQVAYGDPLGWRMHTLTCANTVHVKSLTDLRWAWFWLVKMTQSFWGLFGWYTWSLPGWQLWTFIAATLLAVAGLALRAKEFLAEPKTRGQAWLALAGLLCLAAGVYRFNLAFDPPEGRYLYPALLPIGAALAGGLGFWMRKLPGTLARCLPWGLFAALTALQVWLIAFCVPRLYYNF